MIPTITGLTKGNPLKPGNDNIPDGQDVFVVKKAANDSGDAYEKTMDRILARHNGHDKNNSASNDNANEKIRAELAKKTAERAATTVSQKTTTAVSTGASSATRQQMADQTMNRIFDRHGDYKYANKGFLRRRTAENDQQGSEVEEASIVPANIHDYDNEYRDTIDRIMDRHNGHDREFPAPANDEDFAAQQTMERIKQRHMQPVDPLPEPANDPKHKRKRVIHDRNQVEPGTKAKVAQKPKKAPVKKLFDQDNVASDDDSEQDELLLTNQVEDHSVEEEKKPFRKAKDDDEEENDASPSKKDNILDKIEKNTHRTAEATESIDKKLESMLDDMGVDSLRARERDIEKRGIAHGNTGEKGSSMAQKGKEEGLAQSLGKLLGGAGKGLTGLALGAGGAIASWWGHSNGGENNVTPGGGFSGNDQNPDAKATSPGRHGGRAASMVGPVDTHLTERERAFVGMVSRHEGASYNTTFGMNKKGRSQFITPEQMYGKHLTDLTVNQVLAYQKKLRSQTAAAGIGHGKGTSAVGIGQFVGASKGGGTLGSVLRKMGIPEKDWGHVKFTPELQNRMVIMNARMNGIDPNHVEKWDAKTKKRLGNQWESLDLRKHKIRSGDLDHEISNIRSMSPNRGSTLARASAQGVTNNNVTINNNTTNNVTKGSGSAPKTAKRPPPATPSNFSDQAKTYFSN